MRSSAICVRIQDDLLSKVDRLAGDEMRNRSNMLNKLLAEALALRRAAGDVKQATCNA
jgi:metal-responsive CopG/Arc/MetJ family transcriptional regulator